MEDMESDPPEFSGRVHHADTRVIEDELLRTGGMPLHLTQFERIQIAYNTYGGT